MQRRGKYDPYTGGKKSTETASEEAQTLDLLSKGIKSVILYMFKELKKKACLKN